MSKKSIVSLLSLPRVLLSITCFCLAACSVNPQYTQKVCSARANCKGDEIVGVWQASEEVAGAAASGPTAYKNTLLIRPDGTGLYRSLAPMYENPYIYQIHWSYSGNGIWQVTMKDVSDNMIKQFDWNTTIRYTGNEILFDGSKSVLFRSKL